MRLEGGGEGVPAALPPAPVGAEPVVGRIPDPIERTVVPVADGAIVAVIFLSPRSGREGAAKVKSCTGTGTGT